MKSVNKSSDLQHAEFSDASFTQQCFASVLAKVPALGTLIEQHGDKSVAGYCNEIAVNHANTTDGTAEVARAVAQVANTAHHEDLTQPIVDALSRQASVLTTNHHGVDFFCTICAGHNRMLARPANYIG